MKILKISNLSVWYENNRKIIDGLSLDVGENQIVGLLGKNGQGKTTLLNTIASLHESYSGCITINNHSKLNDNYAKQQRYYVQDYPILFDEMSPFNYFKLLHSVYQKEWNNEKYLYYVKVFNFEEQCQKSISTLSLGNKQKTNIIGALLIRAPLLILDEPLTGLDVVSVEKFYEELRNYAMDGNAIIFSTHIIDVLDRICTKVLIMNNSNIVKSIDINGNVDIRKEFNMVIGNE